MYTNRTLLISILALLSIALCGACGGKDADKNPSDNKVDAPFYTGISVEDQQLVRSVLNRFSSDGHDGVDVTQALSLIVEEGLRNYPDNEWIDDFHLSNVSLDMTSALPENDLWGDYNPAGGSLRFQEVTHDEEGNILSDTWVTKVARSFSAGSVDGFNYRSIHQNDSTLSTVSDDLVSFTVGTTTIYNVDAWHVQQSYSTSSNSASSHNEQYAYQSVPSMALSLHAGSTYSTTTNTVDTIHHGVGWTVDSTSSHESTVTGSLTLYQPSVVNAEANIREAAEASAVASVKNNTKTSTEEWTTVTTVDSYVGPSEELVRREKTTHTFEQETDRDASSGAPLGENSYEHITTTVTHYPREGASATILQNRALEHYPDYVETTKVLRQNSTSYRSFPEEQVSCAIGGSGTCPPGTECREGPNGEGRCLGMGCPNDEKMWGTTGTGAAVCSLPLRHEETITTYRYTDNPHTRHDVEAWKSTINSWSRNWNEEKQFVDTILGEELLTDQIVVDPDFENVPFVWDGSVVTTTNDITQLLDAAGEASESSSTTRTKLDFEAGWGGNSVGLKGSYSHSSANITGANEVLEHNNGGNAVGTVEVKINGSNYTVSAEQWLDQLAP